MKLVSSNEPDFVKLTVEEASESYRRKDDAAAALGILTKLKGIGPATASLLLAVLDPDRILFFADEAFYWLCCGGKKAPIKYNAKEYQDLSERARKLCRRLDVKAVDVERVAFVIMRHGENGPKKENVSPPPKSTGKKTQMSTEKATKEGETSPPTASVAKQAEKRQLPGKRKLPSGGKDAEATDLTAQRRSKRIQRAKEA